MIDAWKIGVSIAMSSNAAAVLGVIQRDLFGLSKTTNLLTGQLNMMKVAAYGAMGAMAGGAVLLGMAKLVEHGKEFVHQQALMKAAALDLRDIQNATGESWKIAGAVKGSTATGNIEMLADLRMVLGDMDKAIQVGTEMAKIATVIKSVTGKNSDLAAYEFIRFLELKGALVDPKTHEISTERLMSQSRLAQAVTIGTRGRTGPRELLNFQQQARAAGAMLDDEGLLNAVPLMQAAGGFRSGTMMAALVQQLVGGVMTQRSANWLVEMGVLPKDAVHVERGGKVVIDKNRMMGSDMIAKDPLRWATDVLRPELVARGYDDDEKITKIIMQSGLRQTSVGALVEAIRNSPSFRKEVDNIKLAQNAKKEPYESLVENDPTTKINAFHAAWTNLLTALGVPMVDHATNMLAKVTQVLTDMSQWAAKNPELVFAIEATATGLAALAVVLGAFAVGTAAASALGLLTGPVGLLALAVGIEAFGRSMSSIPSWLVNMISGAAAGAAVGARYGKNPVSIGLGALVGGGASLAAGLEQGGPLPDLSTWSNKPSTISNEPVGASLLRWLGLKPPPSASAASSGPVPVVITNPNAVRRGFNDGLSDNFRGDPSGSPSFDYRTGHPGAAVP
jgi:hypothetical protein